MTVAPPVLPLGVSVRRSNPIQCSRSITQSLPLPSGVHSRPPGGIQSGDESSHSPPRQKPAQWRSHVQLLTRMQAKRSFHLVTQSFGSVPGGGRWLVGEQEVSGYAGAGRNCCLRICRPVVVLFFLFFSEDLRGDSFGSLILPPGRSRKRSPIPPWSRKFTSIIDTRLSVSTR